MATKQFILSGTSDDPATAATEYSKLMGEGNSPWHSNIWLREGVISTAGKLSNFKVGVAVAPGAGKSWTFTVFKNQSATTLSVTISNGSVLSSLDTDEVVVAAGDTVSVQSVPSGTPTAAAAVYWTCQFTPDTDGETILLSGIFQNILINYFSPLIGTLDPVATEFDGQTLFPTAGTLKRFYVNLGIAPGAGNSRVFTIRKNGVATSLVVTISGTATTGSDTANTVTIAAGDRVTIINTVTGTPAGTSALRFGIVFLPDTQGEWFTSVTTNDLTSSTAVEYQQLTAGVTLLTATENEQHTLAQATTAKKIYVNLSTAPGGANTWIFTLREALANTGLTVSIVGAATSGNAAVDEVVAADALVNLSIDARAGTAISKSQIAILFYNAPSGWSTIAKVSGVTSSTMAKMNGVAVASIAKVNGVAV